MERRGPLRIALGLLLLSTSALVVAVPAAAAEPRCPALVADQAAATAAAAACNGPVEIGSARTESGQTYANPDGSQTIEQYAYPQRVRRPDGTWANLDATLVPNADGSYSPRASTVETTLSGGGSGTLLTGRRAGTEFSLSWPGALPTPTVKGAAATYAEVFPGVDLVVTAHETGFSEVLVVKDRLAAKNPNVRKFSFGSALSGLSWRTTDGRLEAVDRAGKAVLEATAPRMWDSSAARGGDGGGGRIRGSVQGPAEGARSEPIGLTLRGNDLSLEPSTSMLDDPGSGVPGLPGPHDHVLQLDDDQQPVPDPVVLVLRQDRLPQSVHRRVCQGRAGRWLHNGLPLDVGVPDRRVPGQAHHERQVQHRSALLRLDGGQCHAVA